MTGQLVQIVELRQRRCGLRFGVGACGAVGGPKCLQTYETCKFRSAFNRDGELRWFFHRDGDPVPYTASRPSADEWHGPSIPILRSISTQEARINIGATREGESPFGMRGEVTISLDDFEFKNQFGDHYASEREIRGSLGALMVAWVGEAASQMEMYIYEGFKGQTLAEMRQSRFDVIKIEGAVGRAWQIHGYDPLHKALRGKADFPRATDVRLVSPVGTGLSDTFIVSGAEADVSDHFGNTPESYARLGAEIISYTGYSASGDNWLLSGVKRAQLNTQIAGHDAGDGFQRVGYFYKMQYWRIVNYLLQYHTSIDNALIPFATKWVPEGETYLSYGLGTGAFPTPQPVESVCGIAMRDGGLMTWWDPVSQEILMKALRQPRGAPVFLDEDRHLLNVEVIRDPGARITRHIVFYGQVDPTKSSDDATNYRSVSERIDAEAEGDFVADGTKRARIVYSPLMRTDANAVVQGARQLQRYRRTPIYLGFQVAAKDRVLAIGDVINIQSASYVDLLGQPVVTSWEIIQGPKVIDGYIYEYVAQSFVLFERPAFIMANDAPDFASATGADKENACYISQNDGTMPDGSPAYVIQ